MKPITAIVGGVGGHEECVGCVTFTWARQDS